MTSGSVFCFGSFELDLGAYVLRQSGRPVKLEQQPMDLLILLIERRPHLVTRAEITNRLWGIDTFVEAESGINTAIRKVRHALGDAAATPLFIERVPGKGYRFVGEVVETQATDSVGGVSPANRRRITSPRKRLMVAVAAVALVGAVAVTVAEVTRRTRRHPSPLRVESLTRLAGSERDVTLSPDGRQVAFAWDSEREDNFDIYAMLVGSAHPVRLTSDPGADFSPQWSPDGRHIAYVRVRPPGTAHQLRMMTALGGDDRAVSDFPAWYHSSWSPDGGYLAVGRAVIRGTPSSDAGVYLVPIDGSTPRRLTQPPTGSDYAPAFSPDGTRLAYANCRELTFRFDCRVMVVDLDERWQPRGSPRSLTRDAHGRVAGVAWSADGASVLFGAGLPTSRLWRVPADGSAPPQIIEAAGEGAYPARAGARVAFSRASYPNGVYRFERGRPSVPIARSAGLDAQPEYSSDGQRVAFCSDRSGAVEIWIAASDGSAPRQLTREPGRGPCSPSWSSDDRTIAYDAVDADGYWQIWTIPVDGAVPRQITSGAADYNVPRWSRDGAWIYASSTRGGTRDIWRIHIQSGDATQVTTGGSGLWSQESPDHRGILYSASNSASPLMFQAYAGGPPRQLRPCLTAGSIVAPAREGIYYLPCLKAPAADQPLHLFDPQTGRDTVVGQLEEYHRPRDFYSINFRKISLSPRDHSVLYIRRGAATADLLLIEGFR
jgi:Tol biopolymer transport system component/DNA-binding winged helix-turn-helix (wHTH) protein